MDLSGVLPPITTPFLDDAIDGKALRRNVERWLQAGLSGLVVLGTNGEAALLDDDEADRVVGIARDHTP